MLNRRIGSVPFQVLGMLIFFFFCAPPRAAPALDQLHGTVHFSNGQTLSGRIRLAPETKLLVFHQDLSRWVDTDLATVARMDVAVATERMEKIWCSSSGASEGRGRAPDRIYPLRTFRAFITLRDGSVVEGGVRCMLLVQPTGGKESACVLRKREKGRPGQKPEDLVYVRSVDLSGGTVSSPAAFLRFCEEREKRSREDEEGRKGDAAGSWRLEGKLPGAVAAVAVDLEKGALYRALLNRATKKYRIAGVHPGTLVFFIRYPDRILHGSLRPSGRVLPGEEIEPARTALLQAVEAMEIPLPHRKVLELSMASQSAWVLLRLAPDGRGGGGIRKRRPGGNTSSGRIELLRFRHEKNGEWTLDLRLTLFRLQSGWGQARVDLASDTVPALGGIRVGAETGRANAYPPDRVLPFDFIRPSRSVDGKEEDVKTEKESHGTS